MIETRALRSEYPARPVLLSRRAAWLWVLLWAFVSVQTAGLLHRVVHAPGLQGAAAMVWQAHDRSATDWLGALFSGHEGDSGCRLYDQASQGGCLPTVAALPLPAVAPFFFLNWFQGEALARWVALFDARGPPKLR